jgi:vancomycin resistance protein VanJ
MASMRDGSRRAGFVVGAYVAALGVWAIGQWARESTWITGLCFFVPSPALGVVGLVLSAWAWRRGRIRHAAALVGLALAPLWSTALIENHLGARPNEGPPPAEDAAAPLRVVHWNACRGCWGAERIWRELQRWPADMYVLSETPADVDWERAAAAWGPGWQVVYREDAAVLARGRLTAGGVREMEGGWTFPVEWVHDNARLRLLVVDLSPRFSIPRRPLLEWVRAQVFADEPDLVVGDFNTPRRARGLSPLAPGFVHAYDVAGSGWSYTFPTVVAMTGIDQCFVGPRLRVRGYRLVTTLASDHRMQVVDLLASASLREAPERALP